MAAVAWVAAVVEVQSLALELPCAMGVAKKTKSAFQTEVFIYPFHYSHEFGHPVSLLRKGQPPSESLPREWGPDLLCCCCVTQLLDEHPALRGHSRNNY